MSQIDYYFSVLSPYAYLAGNRLEIIAQRFGHDIAYRPFDIAALFARTGGMPLKDRHPARQEYRLQELPRQAAKAQMPINLHPAHWPTNPAPASYAFIAAQRYGAGDLGALAQAFLRACWAEDRDIAQEDVIQSCLNSAGFDPELANKAMLEAAETYARNLEDAVAQGVFGAPFYIAPSRQRFWGQDRLEDLQLHLAGDL